MKINYSEWERKFSLQCELILKYDEQTILRASEILFERIIDRTPVGNPELWHPPYYPKDYKPGTLKESWEFIQEGDVIIIQNTQPYAYRVETGWSTQAPRGMMRISIKEFGHILEEVLRQKNL